MDDSGIYGLHVLPYPEVHWELKHGEPNLDIVVVHGLNGNPFRTWTSTSPKTNDLAGVHWLRDLLFYKVPKIRVMNFGYRADLRANTTATGIRENAESLLSYLIHERAGEVESKRPILWISHSLGGVIVKQALKICTIDPGYESLCPQLTTLMFFGTPHRETSAASWQDLLAAIGQAALHKTENHVDLWNINYGDLAEVSSSFLAISSRFKIINFYEELSHPRVGNLVVNQHSAALQLPNEETVMMTNSDHTSMCKFDSLDDFRFSLVWKRILRLSKTAATPQVSLSTNERDCLASLFMKDAQDIRDTAFALRYPGTNLWLAPREEFTTWKDGAQNSLLWILGGPGYGKTVLTTTILDDLDHRDDFQHKDSLLTYFFWDDKDDARNNASAMYRSIIWQLLRQQPLLFKHILPDFEIQQQRLFDSLPGLGRVLRNMVSDTSFSVLFLVLDALDECEESSREVLLRQLSTLLEKQDDKQTPRLKVFITGRDYDGIRESLAHYPTLTLTPEILQHDIELFVAGKVSEVASARKYDAALVEEVYNVVCGGANGMFLWCAMILGELKKTPLWGVRKKLKALPKGLYEMYDSILRAIHPDAIETARHILQWVVTTMRPLSLQELAYAMGTQYSMMHDAENIPFAYDIEGDVSLCGPILTIRDGHIHLIHQSAKDFLIRYAELVDRFPSLAEIGIDLSQSQTMVAKTCLRYLTSEELASGAIEIRYRYGNEEAPEKYLQTRPFLEYSAAYWLQHAYLCGGKEELTPMIEDFNWPASEKFTAWFQLFWFSLEMYLPYPTNVTPCHIAAQFHLPHYLATFLPRSQVDICEPTYYGTLIHAASWAGNLQSVEFLLGLGADVNIVGGRYGTALQAASGNGHEAIVRRLLASGADVNLAGQSGAHGTALQAAALLGFNSIVKLLLEHGAHVNTNRTDGCFGLALRIAAENGHKSIVQRLLRADADVHAHAQGVDYGTALQQAAETGDESTVELLLTAGMEASSRIKTSKLYDFGTALQAAVSTGQVETVKLLLAAQADVEAQGSRNGTALTIAASSGNHVLVDTLIKAGAQVSKISGGYGTPLIAASRSGKIRVVKQLLDAGANPNERGGFYGNPLRAAASEGHVMVVKLLLESGAKNAMRDVYGGSTLGLTKEKVHGNVISTILEHVVGEADTPDCIGSMDVLHSLLDGDWRGYYYYAAGNRARDEGEVFLTLKSVAKVQDDTCHEAVIEGGGEDKWGKFVIKGEANVDGQISFQKDYAVWGWNYSGQLGLGERAMAGRWGRDGQDVHGTFAFYRTS